MTLSRATRRRLIFWAYVSLISISGLIVAAVAAHRSQHRLADASGAVWLLACLVQLGELRPIGLRRGEDIKEAVTSGAFSFALLLLAGVAPAITVQCAASLIADIAARRSPVKTLFNAGQYALCLGAAGLVLSPFSSDPWVHASGPIGIGRMIGMVLAGITFFATNNLVMFLVGSLSTQQFSRASAARDLAFDASVTAVLLALSPIAAVAATRSAWLVLFLVLPVVGVYQTARV